MIKETSDYKMDVSIKSLGICKQISDEKHSSKRRGISSKDNLATGSQPSLNSPKERSKMESLGALVTCEVNMTNLQGVMNNMI